ncbi:radical SAM family heme chaperone HemW [Zoogloea sp.]|uniref:radical SAM family heme chaperone HemW n=1 Tax=Zoogloea sp. TaxID=49181 RepID=UPI00260171A1|nr:radical SAM family heme chaperone HemW [Zoogloea sp.]MDD3352908.1 radical SAM family heme chaperone HemW [Zoogloea sp.]
MSNHRTIPITPRSPAPRSDQGGFESRLSASPPLALYVHFPWCVKKCPYCDFNSHGVRDEGIPEAAYIQALIADLEGALPQIWGRRVHSIFIGGGTPSLLSPDGLDQLLTGIRMRTLLDPMAEITLEANPGTVDAGRFKAFRETGVNRLSVGIQSFNERHLQALGRIHGRAEAIAAAEAALTHFDAVNLDLMYALPEQSLAEARADLETALALAPPHLSCYHLTLEPNTAFASAPPPIPDPDSAADMQDHIEERLAEAGYIHYETSAFAKPHQECRHNLNYWTFGDYLGIGAGAHGKLSSHAGIIRETRPRHPSAYLTASGTGSFVQERRTIGASELPFEFMMNALRLNNGFPRRLFAERTGLPFEALEAGLLKARQQGLVEVDGDMIRPTRQGRHFLNELLVLFLAGEN